MMIFWMLFRIGNNNNIQYNFGSILPLILFEHQRLLGKYQYSVHFYFGSFHMAFFSELYLKLYQHLTNWNFFYSSLCRQIVCYLVINRNTSQLD